MSDAEATAPPSGAVTHPDRRALLSAGAAAGLGISALALPAASQAISIDGVYVPSVTVYFADRDNDTLGRVTDGQNGPTGFDGGWIDLGAAASNPRALTTDGTDLFFIRSDAPEAIYRVEVATETVTKIYEPPTGVPLDIAADATYVYFTMFNDGVYRMLKDGTGVEELVDGGSPFGVEVVGGTLYVTDSGTGRVWSVPSGGGTVTDLATVTRAQYIAVASTQIFVATDNRTIVRLGLDGSSLGTIFPGGYVFGMSVLGSALYWAGANSDIFRRSELDGTGVVELFTGSNTIQGVVAIA